jgi:hypothetical protein
MDDEAKKIAGNFFDDIQKDITKPEDDKKKADDQKAIDDQKKIDDQKAIDDQKKKDEDEPDFTKPVKKKVTQDESIATLRKQRDEEREGNKIYKETFGDVDPVILKDVVDFVKEHVDGPITKDAITTIITDLKAKKDEVAKLQAELQEREKIVNELDVTHSKEFNDRYKTPFKEAYDTLFLEFATVTADKKILAPKATKEFNDFITANKDIEGVEIKAALNKYAKDFEAESGEKPDLPSMSSLMTSLRSFISAREAMNAAYSNWKVKKEEDTKRKALENQTQTEAQMKASKKMRTDLVSKAFREFDSDSIPFVEDKDIEVIFKEEYQFGERFYSENNVPGYDEVIVKGVKASLWDKWAGKLKDLLDLEHAVEKGERNGLRGGKRIDNKTGAADKADWLGGALR